MFPGYGKASVPSPPQYGQIVAEMGNGGKGCSLDKCDIESSRLRNSASTSLPAIAQTDSTSMPGGEERLMMSESCSVVNLELDDPDMSIVGASGE